MMLKLAFRNIVSRKSSSVIILFMTFAIALFCIANAVFDSTEYGVQSSFVSSFTGNLIIRPKSEVQFSLFGDETPLTGSFTKIENLAPYTDILETVYAQTEARAVLGQISGIVRMELGNYREGIYLFGVDGSEYVKAMNSIQILEGTPFLPGEKGIMMSEAVAKQWKASLGDTIQFSYSEGPVFRIRAAPLTAIFTYANKNTIFDRFALVDSGTLRSILGLGDTQDLASVNISAEKTNMLEDNLDWDSLFDDVEDSEGVFEEISEVEEEELEPLAEDVVASSSWNFLIVCLENPKDAKTAIKKLNKIFKKNGWPVEATDWRHAAGNTALYLYWLRLIFNIGIAVLLIAGFIVVANSLVIKVLDRTREIGTLRAIGARKRFISRELLAETFMMTITSGILGVILGVLISRLITACHISFSNDFLVQLFGSEDLNIFVTLSNVAKQVVLVLLLGLIGWAYPVVTALRVSPVRAMMGAK